SCCLSGFQYLEESLGERKVVVLQPRIFHGRNHAIVEHHVGLYREPIAAVVPGRSDTVFACMNGNPAFSIQQRHLSHVLTVIVFKQPLQGYSRFQSLPHEVKAAGTKRLVYKGLRGDDADARFTPRNHSTDTEPMALYSDA